MYTYTESLLRGGVCDPVNGSTGGTGRAGLTAQWEEEVFCVQQCLRATILPPGGRSTGYFTPFLNMFLCECPLVALTH